jgi:hypothetical protein
LSDGPAFQGITGKDHGRSLWFCVAILWYHGPVGLYTSSSKNVIVLGKWPLSRSNGSCPPNGGRAHSTAHRIELTKTIICTLPSPPPANSNKDGPHHLPIASLRFGRTLATPDQSPKQRVKWHLYRLRLRPRKSPILPQRRTTATRLLHNLLQPVPRRRLAALRVLLQPRFTRNSSRRTPDGAAPSHEAEGVVLGVCRGFGPGFHGVGVLGCFRGAGYWIGDAA